MNCCSCPHGAYATLPILILLAGFALSFIAVNSCKFIRLDLIDYDSYLELGLFGYMESSNAMYCTLYSTEDTDRFDVYFNTSRIMAALSTTIGGFAMMTSWLLSCHPFHLYVVRGLGIGLMMTSAIQGLSFLVWNSNICEGIKGGYFDGSKDYKCSAGQGAATSAAATLTWFIAAIVVVKIPPFSNGRGKATRLHQQRRHHNGEVEGNDQNRISRLGDVEGVLSPAKTIDLSDANSPPTLQVDSGISAADGIAGFRGMSGRSDDDIEKDDVVKDAVAGIMHSGGGVRMTSPEEDSELGLRTLEGIGSTVMHEREESIVSYAYEPSELSYGQTTVSFGPSILTDGVDGDDVDELTDVDAVVDNLNFEDDEDDVRQVNAQDISSSVM